MEVASSVLLVTWSTLRRDIVAFVGEGALVTIQAVTPIELYARSRIGLLAPGAILTLLTFSFWEHDLILATIDLPTSLHIKNWKGVLRTILTFTFVCQHLVVKAELFV